MANASAVDSLDLLKSSYGGGMSQYENMNLTKEEVE